MEVTTIMISGGGTGGHIHPALAIADEIKKRNPHANIQFVGANGRMEMEKVPQAGYAIEGLWISGIDRKLWSPRNWSFPFKLLSSLWKARKLLKRHRPQAVVGVGGFASGPLLDQAVRMGIPTLVQEQNSFPGITNRLLAKRVDRICAGLPGLERWFPKEKIVETGNPLREHVKMLAKADASNSMEARQHWNFNAQAPVVFVMGGSLGAQSMNEAVKCILGHSPTLAQRGYQLLWQCGSRYEADTLNWLESNPCEGVICSGFIDRMDLAYACADAIASRAGAMSIAELALVGKPAILVPSPHVAEDHQTHNARSLTDLGGAWMLPDRDVQADLGAMLETLLQDTDARTSMATNLRKAAKPDAAQSVVDQIESLLH